MDKICEIVNRDILYSETADSGSVNVVTTDASTQYVIKDVRVSDSSHSALPDMSINSTIVAKGISGCVSGSEIVDINSVVKLLGLDKNLLIGTTDGFYTDATKFKLSGASYATLSNNAFKPSGVDVTALSLTNSNAVRFWFINGDFYYLGGDNNATGGLYKRAGGITGAQTTLRDGMSYCRVDYCPITDYFYGNDGSGYVWKINRSTGAYTQIGPEVNNPSTYNRLAVANGHIFASLNNSGSYVVIRRPNNTYVNVNTFGNVNTSDSILKVIHNALENAFYVLHATNATTAYLLKYDATTLALISSKTITLLSLFSTEVFSYSVSTYKDKFISIYGGYVHIIATDGTYTRTAIDMAGFTAIKLTPVDITTLPTNIQDANGPKLRLRITGVKTTL